MDDRMHSLISKIAEQNDQLAFKELVDTSSLKLLSYTNSLVRRSDLAEEIVEDVFVSIWKNRILLPNIKNLTFYLYVACKNIAINYKKRESKFKLDTLDYYDGYEADYIEVDDIVDKKELLKNAIAIIKKLPPKCQLIFRLSREEGFTYPEIAKLLDLSTKTVENQIHIAIKKIISNLPIAAIQEYKKSV